MSNLSAIVIMPPGVSGEPGPFISVGTPIPIREDKLEEISVMLSRNSKPPQLIRARSAFRLPVAVSPKVGNAKLDIGRVERLIAITQGSDTKQVRVYGSMRGPIYLTGAKEISFGFFTSTDAQSITVAVETERAGVEMDIVKDLTVPKFMKVELLKLHQ